MFILALQLLVLLNHDLLLVVHVRVEGLEVLDEFFIQKCDWGTFQLLQLGILRLQLLIQRHQVLIVVHVAVGLTTLVLRLLDLLLQLLYEFILLHEFVAHHLEGCLNLFL